jgi:hypothetical protein
VKKIIISMSFCTILSITVFVANSTGSIKALSDDEMAATTGYACGTADDPEAGGVCGTAPDGPHPCAEDPLLPPGYCQNEGWECGSKATYGPKNNDGCKEVEAPYVCKCDTVNTCMQIQGYACVQHHIPRYCGCDASGSPRWSGSYTYCWTETQDGGTPTP